MAIKMVRQPSEMPNINNIDDIIGLRYAFGNQDGYVIGKGNELDYQINGSNFIIKSGRVVLQGIESDIDANGITIQVDNIATKQYYTVYYEVNLATNTTTIKSLTDTAEYPNVDKGDDLTANTSGTARLELYHFDAQNGIISNVEKLVNSIEYTGTALVGYDIEKGTIEERLTRLGFKQGAVEINPSAAFNTITNTIVRQGNCILGKLSISANTGSLLTIAGGILNGDPVNRTLDIGTLSEEFRPIKDMSFFTRNQPIIDSNSRNGLFTTSSSVIFKSNGTIILNLFILPEYQVSSPSVSIVGANLDFGYEAAPLN